MIGRVLGGKYEILEAVDSGGMALIYKAHCRKTDELVAIKVLKEEFSGKPEYVRRFKKEAEAAFALEHENIVRVRDIGCEEGVYYIVMDFIDGPTLKSLIMQKGVFTEKEAIFFIIQICSALSTAHRKGIIHRDIKPQNILVDKNQTAKVTDFGIAKSLTGSNEEDTEVIGSVHYVSPEQARGESVDARSDIYSLGIMMYEMLTGELPHTGDQSISVVLKHINEQITAPKRKNPELSQSVNNIILKATCKIKRDRYRSMEAFKEDLVQALVDQSGEFVDLPASCYAAEGPTMASVQKHKRWKITILAVLLVILASAVVTGILIYNQGKTLKVTVPDLTDMDVQEATSSLTDMELGVNIQYEESLTVPEGHVISQTPVAQTLLDKGQSVSLVISRGLPVMLMPDLQGITLDDAQQQLAQMRIEIESITFEMRNDMPPGLIINQIPSAESDVRAGDVASLVISTDALSDQLVMPMVTNVQVEQAVTALKNAGFLLCFVYENDNSLPEGTVYEQSPVQGIPMRFGDEVYLWVSAYKDKPYSGLFVGLVNIVDKDSKVKLVLESVQNDTIISYVVWETQVANEGPLSIIQQIESTNGGRQTVKLYVNGAEVEVKEIDFKEDASDS